MTFIVPAEFTVYGVPQKERPPCLIQCEVVELVRSFAHSPWKFRNSMRRGLRVSYLAYVRLPAWIIPPEKWPRLETGEVELRVPLHFNAHERPFPVCAPPCRELKCARCRPLIKPSVAPETGRHRVAVICLPRAALAVHPFVRMGGNDRFFGISQWT